MEDGPLYKILPAAEWARAIDEARVPWAPVDVSDGFVHLSASSQVRETARRHFQDQDDLVLLTIEPSHLEHGTLRWEPSRGGALFPHVYGDVPLGAVVQIDWLPRGPDGLTFPSDVA